MIHDNLVIAFGDGRFADTHGCVVNVLTVTARCVVVVSSCRVFVVVTLTRCVLSSCRDRCCVEHNSTSDSIEGMACGRRREEFRGRERVEERTEGVEERTQARCGVKTDVTWKIWRQFSRVERT